jgi:hypothetical protein
LRLRYSSPVEGWEGIKEVGGCYNVLKCGNEVNGMTGIGHDILELYFPAIVDGGLPKSVTACTSLFSIVRYDA